MLINLILMIALVHGHVDFENEPKVKACQEVVLVKPGVGVVFKTCLRDWHLYYKNNYDEECNKMHKIAVFRDKKDRTKIILPFKNGKPMKCSGGIRS